METIRLQQFRALVETGNMRRASDLLGMSHGGLSKSIKVLESELGVKLTAPDGRGIRITDAGMKIYTHSLEVLRSAERLLSEGKTARHSPETLRIATNEIFSTYFLQTLISDIPAGVSVDLGEYIPGALEAAIKKYEYDVGITYIPIPTEGIDFLKIASMTMDVFTRVDTFTGVKVENLPFVVPISPVEGASPKGIRSIDGWPENLFSRYIEFRVELMESALGLVRCGKAAIFLPRFIASLHNNLVKKQFQIQEHAWSPKRPEIKFDIHLALRVGYLENKLVRKIASKIRTICH